MADCGLYRTLADNRNFQVVAETLLTTLDQKIPQNCSPVYSPSDESGGFTIGALQLPFVLRTGLLRRRCCRPVLQVSSLNISPDRTKSDSKVKVEQQRAGVLERQPPGAPSYAGPGKPILWSGRQCLGRDGFAFAAMRESRVRWRRAAPIHVQWYAGV